MDGFQLCRECKQDEKLKSIPFIFYTATYTDSGDEELAYKLGVDKFIKKPVEPEDFIRAIHEVIKESKSGKIITRIPADLEEKDTFHLYSSRLVKKLEKKMLELEKSELKYRRLCENVKDIVFSIDAEARINVVNCQVEMWGYKPEDVLGIPVWDILTPASREIAAFHFNRAKEGLDLHSVYEVEVVKRDGSIAIVELSMSSLFEDGQFRGRFGVARDITERKRIEDDLKAKTEELERYFTSSLDLLCIADTNGYFDG